MRESYADRLAPPFRTRGVQVRSDDASVNRFVHGRFPLGIGWARMDRDTGRGVGGVLDTTCDIDHRGVTPGRLHISQTHAVPAEHIKRYVLFKSDLWGLFEEDYDAGAITNLVSRKFGATSDDWTGGGNVTLNTNNTQGARGYDMVGHKNALFALTTRQDTDDEYMVYRSTDGASWAEFTGTNSPLNSTTSGGGALVLASTTVSRRSNYDDDMGKLLSFGNELVMAVYKHPDATDGDGMIALASSPDSGSNWRPAIFVPSSDGPKALVDWQDMAGRRRPVLVTSEGVHSIDLESGVSTLMFKLDGDPRSGRDAAVGNDGALYVGLSSGALLRLAITGLNALDIITVGPPGDGLVAERQGWVTTLLSTPSRWLLVGYSNTDAATSSSIFKIDTSTILTEPETETKFMRWSHLWQDTVTSAGRHLAKLFYSTEDDGVTRIHFARDDDAQDIMRHIELPFANPAQNSAIAYQAAGILRLPDDDLGDPQSSSRVIQALVDAQDLTAGAGGAGGVGDEFITLRYGLDGAVDTTVSLGDFLSGQRTQSFASGVGVSARRIGINLLFDRSTTITNRPILYEFEVQAQHVLLDKRAWDFVIDIGATVDYPPTLAANERAEEVIIAALQTFAQAVTLSTFQTGRMAQTRVYVPNDRPPVFDLTVVESAGRNLGYRTGFVTMHVEEGV